MKIELPPQYDAKSVESVIYQKWLDGRVFHAVPDERTNKYSIVIPPPNVTGALHLGHALNGTIQDILTRYHRMKGDNTLWMPGIDHAGIATQAVVEKTIFEKEKKNRHDLGRDELVRRIWEWKEQFGTRILKQLASMGASCDWDRTRFTLDEVCARAVREAFFKMFKDGLIFRGKRLVNWDTHLQTAVADDEIYHETVRGQMTSIKYPVEGSPDEFLIVATTRPETMLGDTAVAVHPDDPRYKHLIGKKVILPLVGRAIPVIADGLLVDPKFGTGVVKVTPAHDPNDYATGVRHGLEQINLLTVDGKVNENGAGEFLGKKYSYTGLRFATAARKQVLADLETLGLIAEVKVHEHEVGHSDRSKTPIEPYLSDQWFVRMGDIEETRNAKHETRNGDGGITLADGTKKSGLAQAAMDAVIEGRVKIVPERYAKGYLDWLGQKRDWCISRQLWWGHRIPVFSIEFSEGFDQKWIDRLQQFVLDAGDSDEIDLAKSDDHLYVCSRTPCGDAILEYLGTFGQDGTEIDRKVRANRRKEIGASWEFLRHNERLEQLGKAIKCCEQDPDVLDTWFSSALWPISTMGWPKNGVTENPDDQLLPYFYPTSLLSTARDILTLWVARMVMFGLYCRGDVPFRQVYVHPVIQDGEGKIMSKSKGNGVDPLDIIGSHGADALRFTLASLATETQDIRLPVVKDAATGVNTSPKFDIGRNFANKIWNASRFILSNLDDVTRSHEDTKDHEATTLEDRWILSRLNATILAVDTAIGAFRFADMANALYQFFWTDLCDWYLEIAKGRIKSGDVAVQGVLLHCLGTSLKLLHPLMPFITEEIWGKVQGAKMLAQSEWPVHDPAGVDVEAQKQIEIIQELTRAIRDVRNQYAVTPSKTLQVTIKPRDGLLAETILQNRGIIEAMSNATLVEVAAGAAKPGNSATAVLAEAEVYVAGVIDKDAELKKLTKRKEELVKFIAGNKGKLENEAFVGKAPAKVVQGLRDQLASQEAELAAVEKNLAELGG